MAIIFYPFNDGYWRAEVDNEELVIGNGAVEYSTYDEDGTMDENRFIGLGKEVAALNEYSEALIQNCTGLRKMPEGLRAFITEPWLRSKE